MAKNTRMNATPRNGIYRHQSCQARAHTSNGEGHQKVPKLKEAAVRGKVHTPVPHHPTTAGLISPKAKSLTSSRPSSAGHKHLLVNKYAACKRRSPQAPATIAHIRAVVNLAGDNLPGPSAAEDAAETADLEQLQQSTPVVTAEPAGPSRAGSLASSQNEDVVVVEVLIGGCQATVDGKAGASKAAAGTKRRSKLLKIFKGAAAAVLATVGVCLLFKRCPGASRSRL